MMTAQRIEKILLIITIAFCIVGVGLRLYRINQSDFVFYDEGYYLNYNNYFYDLLEQNFPDNLPDLFKTVSLWGRFSLGCGKALWFLLSDMRVFWGGYRDWYFPRILSCLAGIGTIALIYLFALRFFQSKRVACVASILLAILPSHVFYSRLAFQEALCTLFFLLGFYFYLFPRQFSRRTFISATFFAGAYFTNYRLIILPVLIVFCEVFLVLVEKKTFHLRKIVWHLVTWFSFVFIIGGLDKGQNTVVTFAWMFYQSSLAKKQFDIINFFSYPYYLFRLESIIFGILFWANVIYAFRRKFIWMLPFCLACMHMFLFSFAAEKGARYMCVVLPFAVMGVASLIVYLYENGRTRFQKTFIVLLTLCLVLSLIPKSLTITCSRSGYRAAIEKLSAMDKDFKSIATQNFIMNLYVPNRDQVVAFPNRFRRFLQYYQQGYRFLIVDTQAFVSYTQDRTRFSTKLHSYLGFIDEHVKPVMVIDNFNKTLLERFVFDHNEHLLRSISFLKENDGLYGEIRIYDIKQCLYVMDKMIGLKEIISKLNPDYKTTRQTDAYGR